MGCLATACLPSPRLDAVFEEARNASRRLVASSFPQLLDLVDDGTLLALQRSPCYHERRADGFQEPLLLLLLGTSHISTLSALQARRVIKSVRPQNVVVELCRSRAGIMTGTPDCLSKDRPQLGILSLTGRNFGEALGRSLKIGGQSAMTLRFLLAVVSDKLSSVAGIPSGEEFRAAQIAADEVDAQLVLGDRPIEITLRRSWESLDWLNRVKLTVLLLRGISSPKLDISEGSLQALRSDDALSTMFDYLSKEFPTLLRPLIYERDRYLAWSLTRSKAVNGSSLVVGVVGRGHMKGIVYALKCEQEKLRFRDLVGLETKSDAASQFLGRLVMETVLAVVLWQVYDFWCTNACGHML